MVVKDKYRMLILHLNDAVDFTNVRQKLVPETLHVPSILHTIHHLIFDSQVIELYAPKFCNRSNIPIEVYEEPALPLNICGKYVQQQQYIGTH